MQSNYYAPNIPDNAPVAREYNDLGYILKDEAFNALEVMEVNIIKAPYAQAPPPTVKTYQLYPKLDVANEASLCRTQILFNGADGQPLVLPKGGIPDKL